MRSEHNRGGYRPVKILVGLKDGPKLAIQCFENRHKECDGENSLFGGKCECVCHKKPGKTLMLCNCDNYGSYFLDEFLDHQKTCGGKG